MSNDSPNFSSILDEAPTEIELPKPLPVGTYHCIVGAPTYDKSSQKGTEFVRFDLKPVQFLDDVDEEELEAAGGLENKTIRAVYYLTPDAIFRLDQFHEHCGLDLSDPMSRRNRNDEIVNAEVLAVVKHEQSQDGTQTFARLARTAPVGD